MIFSGRIDNTGSIELHVNGKLVRGTVDPSGRVSLAGVRNWAQICSDGRLVANGTVFGRVDPSKRVYLHNGMRIPS